MALEPTEAAYLGQPGVVIHAHFQIRVANRDGVQIELICEAKHTRIAAELQRGEMEITVRGHVRHAVRRHRAKVADEPAQADEIALVQRHQADKAAGPSAPRCLAPLIRYHAPNYTTHLGLVRDASAARCRCGREFCWKFLQSRLPSRRSWECHGVRTATPPP